MQKKKFVKIARNHTDHFSTKLQSFPALASALIQTLLYCFFSICLLSPATSSAANPENGKASVWREASSGTAKGVALLIGGLNNKPEIMSDLADELHALGYHTRMVRLTGHETDTDWPSVDYAEAWREDLSQATQDAKTRYPALPRVVVAYSLGATVALAEASNESDLFKAGIFFAPAIGLKFHALLIRLTLPLRIFSLNLPSIAPEKWRAHNSTAVLAYKGLFDLIEQIVAERIQALPLCFILDPKDELVSTLNTARWASSHSLEHVRLIENSTEQAVRRHLLVDRAMRGEKSWSQIRQALASCLPQDLK